VISLRFGWGQGFEFECGGGGDRDESGLTFDIECLGSGGIQCGAFRIELVIVGEHEGVAAPHLVLQRERPEVSLLVLATDAGAGELHVAPMGGNPDSKLLDSLVENAEPEGGASAHQAIADRDQVEHLGDDPGGQRFESNLHVPCRFLGTIGERLTLVGAGRHFACTGEGFGLQLQTWNRGDADPGCFTSGAHDPERAEVEHGRQGG
jgi:hypothetical protein